MPAVARLLLLEHILQTSEKGKGRTHWELITVLHFQLWDAEVLSTAMVSIPTLGDVGNFTSKLGENLLSDTEWQKRHSKDWIQKFFKLVLVYL